MKRAAFACVWFAVISGCDADRAAPGDAHDRGGELPAASRPEVAEVPAPLAAAHCSVQVDGIGEIAMEDDYLPHVIQCENGGANLEALKAQAIAARSVVYYSIETNGSICDGQGCQVYSCGADPEPIHIQAVQETSGVYLMYNNTLTYGFFVAGDSGVQAPSCVGTDGAAATEHWVTYNEGKSGTDVLQTELGFVYDPGDPGYGQNRGCMGQWSARCLENNNGYDYVGILRFFYGDDIVLEQAQGDCVIPMAGSTSGPMDTGMVDTGMTGLDTGLDSGDSSSVGASASASVSASESDTGDVSAGTEGSSDDSPNALPATFGENTDAPAGCACGPTEHAWHGWIALVLLWPRRRSLARA